MNKRNKVIQELSKEEQIQLTEKENNNKKSIKVQNSETIEQKKQQDKVKLSKTTVTNNKLIQLKATASNKQQRTNVDKWSNVIQEFAKKEQIRLTKENNKKKSKKVKTWKRQNKSNEIKK